MLDGSGLIAAGLLFIGTLFYSGKFVLQIRVLAMMLLIVTVGCYYVSLTSQGNVLKDNHGAAQIGHRQPEHSRKAAKYSTTDSKVVAISLGSDERNGQSIKVPNKKFNGSLTVIAGDGEKKKINWHKPVLFFATWCPHCESVMNEIGQLPIRQRPDVVSVYTDSENPSEEILKAKDKLEQAGLNVPVYVCFEDMTGRVETMPSLVVKTGGNYNVIKNPRQIINTLKGEK
ncbi:MAG: hypothetical protein ACM3UZ_13630 [Acidobacteriota bacterium]